MIHRAELVQTLYETLPPSHQERIKTSKQVVGISTSDWRVEVHCSDDSIEYGSMVFGADGVASQVRHMMKNITRGRDPSTGEENEAEQFPSSFSLLYGAAPVLPGMPVGTSWEAHGTGMATALFVGTQKAWFFWYERLPPSTGKRERYSKVDEANFVERWAHVHVTDEIALKDVYDARLSSGMKLVEEGMVAGDWHRNRIVLVGDAAVKVSPNLAFGFNGVSNFPWFLSPFSAGPSSTLLISHILYHPSSAGCSMITCYGKSADPRYRRAFRGWCHWPMASTVFCTQLVILSRALQIWTRCFEHTSPKRNRFPQSCSRYRGSLSGRYLGRPGGIG